jgi:uncharacterized protein YbjT (DUF2867 family)
MKYAITGAAGHISKPLALQLLKAGHEVRAMGRNQKHLKQLADAGAATAIGNLEDAEFLMKAFENVDAVYTMCPSEMIPTDFKTFYEQVGKNYAAAINNNNIKYVVNLSSIGAHLAKDAGPVSGLHRVEQTLNELKDVNVKHLRATYFYRNLFDFIDMIRNMGFMGSNFAVSKNKYPVSDFNEIALAAAEELLALDFSGHSIRYIASDETGTDEIASEIGKAIGKPDLKWAQFTDEQAFHGMKQSGLPDHIAAEFVEMFKAINDGILLEDYWKHRPKLGKVKLEDFAKTFAAVYHSEQNVFHDQN